VGGGIDRSPDREPDKGDATKTMPTTGVGTSRSFKAEAISTSTRAGRMMPSGAFEESRAPTNTAGSAPIKKGTPWGDGPRRGR